MVIPKIYSAVDVGGTARHHDSHYPSHFTDSHIQLIGHMVKLTAVGQGVTQDDMATILQCPLYVAIDTREMLIQFHYIRFCRTLNLYVANSRQLTARPVTQISQCVHTQ